MRKKLTKQERSARNNGFRYGLASIFSLDYKPPRLGRYGYSADPAIREAQITEALKKDWEKVGQDINAAMGRFAEREGIDLDKIKKNKLD